LIRLAFLGMPEGTRTPDLQVRNLTFYPTELRARTALASISIAAPNCLHRIVLNVASTTLLPRHTAVLSDLAYNNLATL
jgi:hypothetical protein